LDISNFISIHGFFWVDRLCRSKTNFGQHHLNSQYSPFPPHLQETMYAYKVRYIQRLWQPKLEIHLHYPSSLWLRQELDQLDKIFDLCDLLLNPCQWLPLPNLLPLPWNLSRRPSLTLPLSFDGGRLRQGHQGRSGARKLEGSLSSWGRKTCHAPTICGWHNANGYSNSQRGP